MNAVFSVKSFFMRAIMIMLVFSFILYSQLEAQDNTIKKEKFHWGRDQDTSAGYAQAIKVDNMIYISGTVSREITPEGIKRVYEALEKTLQHYGATFQNVIKENLYTTDIEAMKTHNAARKAFYKGDFPAATWVQISRLFTADAKLEIELIAYLPKK
jgi:enamine deaminase RidA (YjgF/YER057c/UK114 family)